LTGHIDESAKDETGQLLLALGDMNASLLTIVTRSAQRHRPYATSSSEIAAGNQDLSQPHRGAGRRRWRKPHRRWKN
jgi:methyl-accepting chemotaxis protein